MNRSAGEFVSSAVGVRDAHPRDGGVSASPFLVENETAYRYWRERKLAAFMENLPHAADPITVADPQALSDEEYAALTGQCRQRNFAFYRVSTTDDKPTLRRLWAQLGLHSPVANPCADADGISSIAATPDARYIPYTSRALKWHTDGYYNAAADTIRAFAMHCVHPAGRGGENRYFDPEILYILLRDESPDYVAALMHPQTLTVPQNSEETNHKDTRAVRQAPVLALHPQSGDLIVRYTERRHYVTWRRDDTTAAARAFIREVLQTRSKYCIAYRLNSGEGVICNNVLHNRSEFTDVRNTDHPRLLYRARYRDRIADTGHAAPA